MKACRVVRIARWVVTTVVWLAAVCVSFEACAAEPLFGAVGYLRQCARCHGTAGQGVADAYEERLMGELSIAELAAFIEETMPEDAPETCVGEEARQIAEFVHGAFYSAEARRAAGIGASARVALSRLTVAQYRNAVADLLGHFTPAVEPLPEVGADEDGESVGPARGLRAEYFQSKGMSKADALKAERVDARIDFDFGEGAPEGEIDASQFAIVWNGSLVAKDTGYYQFRIRTPNGARLYLNNDPPRQRRRRLRDDSSVAGQSALIDAWVSSGKVREPTARVFLLGGRNYPLRLEFFKYQEKTASIRLEWKPPHGTWSVLNGSNLRPEAVRRVFVVDTPFPADDRSLGYERGSSVSREWHEATMRAAIATANEVVARLPLLAGLEGVVEERAAKTQTFVEELARVAYRRELIDDERAVLEAIVSTSGEDTETAVRRAVLFTLSSPQFLYADLGDAPTDYGVAARLALVLWDSIPDAELLRAAAEGRLTSREGIEAEALRMMTDQRAKAKAREFFEQWLELDERDLAKDRQIFPEFDEAVAADLRMSLELFVEGVVWSDASDYRELLLADYLLLNERLLELYGDDEAAGAGEAIDGEGEFRRVEMTAEERAGVLTHPYLLSAFAYHNSTSPIHRGVFLTRNIVGRSLAPPPMAVAFDNAAFAPELSMREKITELTRDKACMSCHSIINPLGFALEHFDAVGRWRVEDNDRPVDATSEYTTASGESLELRGARDIAEFAAGSDAASREFVGDVFRHLTKHDPAAFGEDVHERLRTAFVESGYHMRELWVRVATLAAAHEVVFSAETERE